jgi:hypothetical protein
MSELRRSDALGLADVGRLNVLDSPGWQFDRKCALHARLAGEGDRTVVLVLLTSELPATFRSLR